MAQWLVEEAVFEAVEMSDRFRRLHVSGNGQAAEPPALSPHEELAARHAANMMPAGS